MDEDCDDHHKLENVFVMAEEQFIEKVQNKEMNPDEFAAVLSTHHQLLVANAITKHSLVPTTPSSTDQRNSSNLNDFLSLSASAVVVPSSSVGDMNTGEENLAAAVRRLSMLTSGDSEGGGGGNIVISEATSLEMTSAVGAAFTAWDKEGDEQRRVPLTDLVCVGAIPKSHLLGSWCRLVGAEQARTGGMSLMELVAIANGQCPDNEVAINLDPHTQHRIRKDLHRTCCNNEFTSCLDQGPDGELYQILAAYASIDSEVGYVQGMNYIAAMCLTAVYHAAVPDQQMLEEEEEEPFHSPKLNPNDVENVAGKKKKIAKCGLEAGFLLFVRLMQGSGLRRLYDRQDDHLHELILRLDWHIRGCLPDLHVHLEEQEVGATLFAVEWLTTLFVYNVPFDTAAAILSVYMVEGGLGCVVQLGVALLAQFEQELLTQQFDTLLTWFKNRLKSLSISELLAAVRQLGRRVRHIKDYTTTPIATDGTAAGMTEAVSIDEGTGGMGSLLNNRAFHGFAVGTAAGGLTGGLGGLGELGGSTLAGLEGDRLEAWRRLRRPRWMPDEEATRCHSATCTRRFSALKQRKHHCRSCGCVFCGPCALTRSPLPHLGYSEMVRVCDFCAATGALVPAHRLSLYPDSPASRRYFYACDMPSRSTEELLELRTMKEEEVVEVLEGSGLEVEEQTSGVGGMVLSPIKNWIGRHDHHLGTQWLNRLRRAPTEGGSLTDDLDGLDGGDQLLTPITVSSSFTSALPPLPPPSPPPSPPSTKPPVLPPHPTTKPPSQHPTPNPESATPYVPPPSVRPPPPPLPPPRKAPPPTGARPAPPPPPSTAPQRLSVSSSPETLDLFLTTAVGSALVSSSPTPAPFFPAHQPTDEVFQHSPNKTSTGSSDSFVVDMDDSERDTSEEMPWRRSVMYDGQPTSNLFDADPDEENFLNFNIDDEEEDSTADLFAVVDAEV